MTYRNRRIFPHPVLGSAQNDYQSEFTFNADYPVSQVSEGGKKITITVDYLLDCPTLLALIKRNLAQYVTVVECTKTYRRESYPSGHSTQDLILLECQNYDDKLTLTPYIVAVGRIEKFNPPEVDDGLKELIPGGVNLPAGAILAIGKTNDIDLDEPAPITSIFDLAPDKKLQEGEFKVDLSGQRIAIYVHPATKGQINKLRKLKACSPIFYQSLYLHAVDKAIRNCNEVAEENWAKVIKRKLAEIDVDVDGEKNVDLDENSEKYAQRLLKTPLGDMLDILHGQFNAVRSKSTDYVNLPAGAILAIGRNHRTIPGQADNLLVPESITDELDLVINWLRLRPFSIWLQIRSCKRENSRSILVVALKNR